MAEGNSKEVTTSIGYDVSLVPEWCNRGLSSLQYEILPVYRTIKHFHECKQDDEVLLTDPFYTSNGGYKATFSVYPNGRGSGKGTHVSVYIHLIREPNADNLPFPIYGIFTVQALNWKKDHHHIEKSIQFDDKTPVLEYRIQDTGGEIVVGREYDQFISHKDVSSMNVLYEDMMCFKINYTPIPDYSKYLKKASAKGTVTTRQSSLGLFGAAGTGKTSMLRLLNGQEPVYEHNSTPVLNPTEYYKSDEDKLSDAGPTGDDCSQWNSDDDDDTDIVTSPAAVPQALAPIKQGLLIVKTGHEWSPATEQMLLERLKNSVLTLMNLVDTDGTTFQEFSPLLEGFAIKDKGSVITQAIHSDDSTSNKVVPVNEAATSHSSTMQIPVSCWKLSKKILNFINANKELRNLGITHFVSVCDTGGQAAFLDIAPALVKFNSFNLVLLKLNEHLEAPAQFFYSVKGVKVGNEKRSISTRSLVYSFVSSKSKIQKPRIKGTEVVKKHQKPKFMILGTHLDKYREEITKCQSKEEKNRALKFDLAAFDDCLCHNSSEKVMYCLNTLDRDKQTLRLASMIRKLVLDNYVEVEIPVSWYIFQLAINAIKSSGENEGIIEASTLISIGTINNIPFDEAIAALHYFHDLQLCLYYPSVVPRVVFTNPQFLFDKISQIIGAALDETQLIGETEIDKKNLRNLGKFKESFLSRICKGFKDVFTVRDFLKLMIHLFIVSSLPDTDEYFIPCVLTIHPNPCEDFLSCTLPIEPLLFVWDNSVPNGLFPSLTTKIQAHEGVNNARFLMSQNEMQYRNKISFNCADLSCKVVLVECNSFIGVMVCTSCTEDISERCLTVRIAISSCIQDIVKRFDWLPSLALPSQAFICKIADHKCISLGNTIHLHVCWSDLSRKRISCELDSSLAMPQQTSHLVWWGKSIALSLDHSKQLKPLKLFHLLQTKCSDWDKIGRELGISNNYRTSINHDRSLTDEARLERILVKWLEEAQVQPTWLDFMNILTDGLKFNDIARQTQVFVSTIT